MYSSRFDPKLTKKLEKEYKNECYSGATSYLFKKAMNLWRKISLIENIKCTRGGSWCSSTHKLYQSQI